MRAIRRLDHGLVFSFWMISGSKPEPRSPFPQPPRKIAKRTNPHAWKALKESGRMRERYVQMAIELRFSMKDIPIAADEPLELETAPRVEFVIILR